MRRPRVVRVGVLFDPEQKVWRNQYGLESQLDALLEGVARLLGQRDEPLERVDLVLPHGPAVGVAGQMGHDLLRTTRPMLPVPVATNEDLLVAGGEGRRLAAEWPMDLRAVEEGHAPRLLVILGLVVGDLRHIDQKAALDGTHPGVHDQPQVALPIGVGSRWDLDDLDALAIHRNLEWQRRGLGRVRVAGSGLWNFPSIDPAHPEFIFGVGRELVLETDRPFPRVRNGVGLLQRALFRAARSQVALERRLDVWLGYNRLFGDLLGGGHVALHQYG